MGKVLDEPKYAVVDPAPSASKIGEHRRARCRWIGNQGVQNFPPLAAATRHPLGSVTRWP